MNSPSSPRILIIEDEDDLRDAMVTYLELDGMQCHGVGSLAEAEDWLAAGACDVLVLDLGLPDGDGLLWLDHRRELLDKGCIITTARGCGASRVAGVKAGADVYLVKPIELEELAASIGNLMRRLQPNAADIWRLDSVAWYIEAPNGVQIKLTDSEHKLLSRLAQSPGEPVARDELVSCLGYDPLWYDPRRMEILVRRLRSKVKEAIGHTLPVTTVQRAGYAFTARIVVQPVEALSMPVDLSDEG